MCLAVRYGGCATKVRGVALINLANEHLLAFRYLDLCYYTDKHLCLKTDAYGMCLVQNVKNGLILTISPTSPWFFAKNGLEITSQFFHFYCASSKTKKSNLPNSTYKHLKLDYLFCAIDMHTDCDTLHVHAFII